MTKVKVIIKGHRSVPYKSCIHHDSKTAEFNLIKLHWKVNQHEKVSCAQNLGSYNQGQWEAPTIKASGGWSGGAMVLGKLPVPGHPTIWITVGQGPTALAVGAGGGYLDIFTLIYPFFPLSPTLLEMAQCRL